MEASALYTLFYYNRPYLTETGDGFFSFWRVRCIIIIFFSFFFFSFQGLFTDT